MKFVLASYGTRGDVEPCAAVGRELLRRGHEVRMAVPPDLVGFVESAGLAAVAYGLDTQAWRDTYRNFWTRLFRNFWTIRDPIRLWREIWELINQCWAEMSTTLTSLADGADLLFTGVIFEQPLPTSRSITTFRWPRCIIFPVRANGQLLPIPAGAADPLRNDGVRVAVLAPVEEGRGRAAP